MKSSKASVACAFVESTASVDILVLAANLCLQLSNFLEFLNMLVARFCIQMAIFPLLFFTVI
jgi:hypothetical protein